MIGECLNRLRAACKLVTARFEMQYLQGFRRDSDYA